MRVHTSRHCLKLLILMLIGMLFSRSNTVFAHGPITTATPQPNQVSSSNDGATQQIYSPIPLKQTSSIVPEEGPPDHDIDHDLLEHFYEDFVIMDATTEARLASMMRPSYGLRPTQSTVTAADAHLVGEWSAVQEWPVVAIHTTLLPNGKVLAYDSVGDGPAESYPVHNFTRAAIWDPATNEINRADVDTGYNLFCSGQAHLPDGQLFIAGGNLNSDLQGLETTHTFNHQNNSWTLGPLMSQGGRWYPSVTPLANGEMLITEGGPDTPEVRTPTGSLRTLSNASLDLPLYPWLQVAPDGQVFYAGPSTTMRYLDTTGAGSWQTAGERDTIDRDYGSFAMYDIGKLLVAGGGSSSPSASIIDLNNGAQTTTTGSMNYGRRQHNLTILADGTVLATGGNSSGEARVDLNNGVYAAELWNPATGQWTTLASMQVTRQYHSTALLLPDGRVLSAGGGICDTCAQVGYLAKNAEVFSPPYLFKTNGSGQLAPRPTNSATADTIGYQQVFTINTPEAATIQKVSLVRLSSVTHSVNMEQRYVPLTFTSGNGQLTVTTPANMNIAPPGYYMLFIINTDGVPSVAKMIQVQPIPAAPTLSSATASIGQVSLNWTSVSDATNYKLKYGTSSGNYPNVVSVGNVTSYTVGSLANGIIYYFVVVASNSEGDSLNSNERSSATPIYTVVLPIILKLGN